MAEQRAAGVQIPLSDPRQLQPDFMLNTVTTVVIALLGVHIIAKFAFFALPYRKRRAALDKSYGDKPSATTTSDLIALGFTVALAAKEMSYAIQGSPWRPWPQMAVLAVLVGWNLVLILR